MKKLIQSIAREGKVVILGRAACYFLRNEADCYRFHITAPMEWRLKHAVEELKIPADIAQQVIANRDKNQHYFLKFMCGAGYDEHHLFHETLNMSLYSFDRAAQVVLATAGLSARA